MNIQNASKQESLDNYRIRSITFEVHDGSFDGFYYLVKIKPDVELDKVYFVSKIDSYEKSSSVTEALAWKEINQFISLNVEVIWQRHSDWFD